jgi:hypothetical protein
MGAKQHRGLHSSKSERFADLAAPESTVDDFVEKTKQIGEVDPKPAIQTTGIETPIHQCVVPLDHHKPFALETIHGSRSYLVYLMRFITNAKQPAKSPPPKIVVAKDTYGLAPPLGCEPSNRSRTPPWTIRTDRVRSAPIPNHHEKDLTAVLVRGSQP